MGKKKRHDPIHDWLDAGIRRAFGDKRAWNKFYNKGGSDSDSSWDSGRSGLQRRSTTGGISNGQRSQLLSRHNGFAPGFGNNVQNFSQGAGNLTYSYKGSRGALTHPGPYNSTLQTAPLPPLPPMRNSRQLPYLGPVPGQFNSNVPGYSQQPSMGNMGPVPQQELPHRPARGASISGPSSPFVQRSGLPQRPGQFGPQRRRATAPAQLPLRNPSHQSTHGLAPRANTDIVREKAAGLDEENKGESPRSHSIGADPRGELGRRYTESGKMGDESALEHEDRHQKRGVITFNLPGYKIAVEKKPSRSSQTGGRDSRSSGDKSGQGSSRSLGALGRRLSQRIKRSSNGFPILTQFAPEPGHIPYRQVETDQAEQQRAQEHADRVLALQRYAQERREAEKKIQRETVEVAERYNKPMSYQMEVSGEVGRVAREREGGDIERIRKERREATQSRELRDAVRKYGDEKRRKDEEERRAEEQGRTRKGKQWEAAGREHTGTQRRRREIAAPRQIHRPAKVPIVNGVPATMNKQQEDMTGTYIERMVPRDKVPPAALTEENLRGRQEGFTNSAVPSIMNRGLGDMTRTILEGYVSLEDIRRREEEERHQRWR
ncbi:uncharacterized protein BP5553_05301 [Venustampulla echinocandica]|uniref:Uncharacterized protein n=1 Tax=Venustampulla echinocandica TaxID=2656787 RepID=A0A370TQT6_9HELO|nr:uncharacterized protein BP5553_05301 [Venustampulla echinocandica]RDL37868.1 hypothetical protein BP5553_05301 [Venustampulla echinocandica]